MPTLWLRLPAAAPAPPPVTKADPNLPPAELLHSSFAKAASQRKHLRAARAASDAAAAAVAAAASEGVVLLINAVVLDTQAGAYLPGIQRVALRDGVIAAIGPMPGQEQALASQQSQQSQQEAEESQVAEVQLVEEAAAAPAAPPPPAVTAKEAEVEAEVEVEGGVVATQQAEMEVAANLLAGLKTLPSDPRGPLTGAPAVIVDCAGAVLMPGGCLERPWFTTATISAFVCVMALFACGRSGCGD